MHSSLSQTQFLAIPHILKAARHYWHLYLHYRNLPGIKGQGARVYLVYAIEQLKAARKYRGELISSPNLCTTIFRKFL